MYHYRKSLPPWKTYITDRIIRTAFMTFAMHFGLQEESFTTTYSVERIAASMRSQANIRWQRTMLWRGQDMHCLGRQRYPCKQETNFSYHAGIRHQRCPGRYEEAIPAQTTIWKTKPAETGVFSRPSKTRYGSAILHSSKSKATGSISALSWICTHAKSLGGGYPETWAQTRSPPPFTVTMGNNTFQKR